MGARHVVRPKPDAELAARVRVNTARREAKRAAEARKVVEATMLAKGSADLTMRETAGIASTVHISKERLKEIIIQARETFLQAAPLYVQGHLDAMNQALANGDPKSLEVATRAAQWGMENLGFEGERIVDKEKTAPSDGGPTIFIGIKLGGSNTEVEGGTPTPTRGVLPGHIGG